MFEFFPIKISNWVALAALAALAALGMVLADAPKDATPLDGGESPKDFRLHFELSQADKGLLRFGEKLVGHFRHSALATTCGDE